MPRYSAGTRTGAGSTTLPIISLYNAAAGPSFRLVEVGVFNTTATAVAIKLCKLTTAGTPGAGLTETIHDAAGAAATCTAFTTHTVTATIVDMGYNTTLGAAVGSGVIWTFGGANGGVAVPVGTANGVGVIVATGTGQVCDAYFVWDE